MPEDRRAGGVVAVTSDDLLEGEMVGEYQVLGTLGQGGMATVYSAIHPVIGKRVAVKVLSRVMCTAHGASARFTQEAQAVNRIGHPNIVDIFSIGTLSDGRPYFVMEWLDGESLGTRIERALLSIDDIIDVLDQLCSALEAVHQSGIVHRDLKPDNLFLVPVRGRPRPMVKLLDFGIAKLRDTAVRATATGITVGTPAYVSPEQARGLDIDSRSDVYSLGIVAYEMITGEVPFLAPTALDTLLMHVQAPAPAPRTRRPELPELLDALIVAMLAKSPDARPSLEDVAGVLSESRAEIALAARDAATSSSPPRASGPRWTRPSSSSSSSTSPTNVLDSLASRSQDSVGLALTLSASMLDIPLAEPRLRARWPIVVALVVAVAGGGIFVATRDGGRPTTPASSAEVVAASEPAPSTDVEVTPVATALPDATAARLPQPASDAAARPKVILRISTPGTQVKIDGTVVAGARDGTEIAFGGPGNHVLSATAPGYLPLQRTIAVRASGAIEASIALEPVARKRKPVAPKQSPAAASKTKVPRGENYTLDPFKQKETP